MRLTPVKSRKRKPLVAEDGPFLIWSHYWKAWHRRSVDADGSEHATGYTDDLVRAGHFGFTIASAYHSLDPRERDEAIPVTAMRKQLEHRASELEREAEQVRQALGGQ